MVKYNNEMLFWHSLCLRTLICGPYRNIYRFSFQIPIDNLSVIVIYTFIQPPISVLVHILIQSFRIILLKLTVFSEFCFISMHFFQVFLCVYMFLLVCIYVNYVYTWCAWRPKEYIGFPWMVVTDSSELPCGYWKPNLGLLQEPHVLLSTKISILSPPPTHLFIDI